MPSITVNLPLKTYEELIDYAKKNCNGNCSEAMRRKLGVVAQHIADQTGQTVWTDDGENLLDRYEPKFPSDEQIKKELNLV